MDANNDRNATNAPPISKREESLWREFDEGAYTRTLGGIVILVLLYFFVYPQYLGGEEHARLRGFLDSVILNTIPILIVGAISYRYFRRSQLLRAEVRDQKAAFYLAQEVNLVFGTKFSSISTELNNIRELLAQYELRLNEIAENMIAKGISESPDKFSESFSEDQIPVAKSGSETAENYNMLKRPNGGA